MLSLYMAGYTYPAEGLPGHLPLARGSASFQFFRFDFQEETFSAASAMAARLR